MVIHLSPFWYLLRGSSSIRVILDLCGRRKTSLMFKPFVAVDTTEHLKKAKKKKSIPVQVMQTFHICHIHHQ